MKQINIVFENESKTKTEHINYTLYDHPTVDNVFNLLEITKDKCTVDSRIDVRRSHSGETTDSYATEMNQLIEKINQLDEYCQIDDSLVLDLSIYPHEQVQKLNRLHEIFQLYSENYGTHVNETQTLLERVNILVHLLEAQTVERDQVFVVAKQVGTLPRSLDLSMTDEDHFLRKPHALWGVLEMDYSTIGKDLGACFWTNDVDLIKSGQLRQQSTLTPGVALNFMQDSSMRPTDEMDEFKMNEFYEWCEKNKLGDYIDYKLPEYRLGRMRLGEISKDYSMAEILDLTLYYPTVVDIELISS